MSTDGDPLLSSLLGIAEELYGLPPAEFTGTRNAWAKQTKADGDAALAKRVTELRKPSTAAWVVNVLMRHQGDQMAQVLDLGASLRRAQADLDGEALRDLARQRRQLTTAVTRQGRDLAKDLGQRLTEAVADQVQDTLHAAMVDEAAAQAVTCGLLVTALTSTGVASAPDEYVDAIAVPEAIGRTARPRPHPARAPAKRGLSVVPDLEEAAPAVDREAEARAAALEEARQAVTSAKSGADEARKKVRKATKRIERGQAATLQTAEELEEARRRVAELEHRLEQLDDESVEADRRKERAEAKYAAAQEALEQAQTTLQDLS